MEIKPLDLRLSKNIKDYISRVKNLKGLYFSSLGIPEKRFNKIEMEVDNLELIKPLLKFDSSDDFYYLQILQRKKENPQLGRNSRVIKNYYIKSVEELEKKYDEIKQLCQFFNARASLRLNKRSFEQVAFKTLINIANNMSQRDYVNMPNSYDRACGMGHSEDKGNKTWILDIDAEENGQIDLDYVGKVTLFISKVMPLGLKQVAFVPSKTGLHIITKPFDLREFSVEYPEISIHKDNPTNLYIH